MRLAVAQIRTQPGDIEFNLAQHHALIELAIDHQAELIVFPELSLTGYEPKHAQEWARPISDPCFQGLQRVCDQQQVTIAAGFPLESIGLPSIASLVLRPQAEPLLYAKVHLHSDEVPYFTPGSHASSLIHQSPAIALAICFELSVPQHAQRAIESGATAYIASVAKTASGVAKSCLRLSEIARTNSLPVAMANCLGLHDGEECTGHTSAWNRHGDLIAQLDASTQGVIILDLLTCNATVTTLSRSSQ